MLVCPWHSWEFDCVTGEHDRLAGCRLATYPVTVRDGEVLVEFPNA
jgi:nitrite reductase/ring-hydroxylating ferredoxin subunit